MVSFIDAMFSGGREEVRVKRSIDYGTSWISSQQVSNNSAGYDLSNPVVAVSRDTVAWICAVFGVSSTDDNVAYYYTTDGGGNWTYGSTIGSSSTDENLPDMRANKSDGSVTLVYNKDPGDSVMFT